MGSTNSTNNIIHTVTFDSLTKHTLTTTYSFARKLKSAYIQPLYKSRGMTHLMLLVLLTKEHPDLLPTIEDYIKHHPKELEKLNGAGWTPLMLAVANTQSCSSLETVELLLNCGANVNHTGNKKTPLMIACAYAGTTSSFETVKLLCDNPNININAYYQAYHDNVMTALSFAVYTEKPNIDVVNLLIQLGIRKSKYMDKDILMLQHSYMIKPNNQIMV